MGMKKIAKVNGSLSDLITVLQNIQNEYCDMNVSVCGVMPVQIYWDNEHGTIVLDSEENLEEGE